MKLILNDSTLEITSRQKENRNKINADGTFITSGGIWDLTAFYSNCTAFFIDLKAGDELVVTPQNGKRIYIALTANETPVNQQAVSFANGTTGRIRQDSNYTASISNNCYLWVLCDYDVNGSNPEDFEPNSIVINGLTLDANGYL